MLRQYFAHGCSSGFSTAPASALSSPAAAVAGAVLFVAVRPNPYSLIPPSFCRRCCCPAPLLCVQKIPGHRAFHSSSRLFPGRGHGGGGPAGMDSQTHYETLDVPMDAPMSEIKKSFYRLSKLHHPDHNPQDPHAPRRFMRVSEAYAVLGHADKRAVYDREVARTHHRVRNHRTTTTTNPNASYHSTGPAGGRPASGLSRRRNAFYGPHPSMFRNTGNGSATPGGGAADAGHRRRPPRHPAADTNADADVNPAEARRNPYTPHFDRDANERTLRHLDSRSAQRRAAAEKSSAAFTEPTMTLGFLVITAALAAGVVVPVLMGSWWDSADGGGGGGGGGRGAVKRKTSTSTGDA